MTRWKWYVREGGRIDILGLPTPQVRRSGAVLSRVLVAAARDRYPDLDPDAALAALLDDVDRDPPRT